MSYSNAIRALDPIWFRFTDEGDTAQYGTRWYRYAEADVMRMSARDLIALETDLGMPIVAVMNGFRASTVLGDTAVAWMGVRAENQKLAGDFDEFNPLSMTIEWSKSEPEPDPKDELADTPERPDSSSGTTSSSDSPTSETMGTVALPVMPVVE